MMEPRDVPSVSIVLPVYNAGAFLRQAVQSTLDQTFRDFELIIVDDASTDGSADLIASFHDPRIRSITHARNLGLVSSLNDGLAIARGRYIARMDADDVMKPERLRKQFDYLESNPGIALVAAFVDLIDPEGQVTGQWNTDRNTVTEAEIRAMMPRTNCIAHPTVLIRRAALGDLRYEPRMVEGEDWDLWLRLLSRGARIAKIPEVLLEYRKHPSSFTAHARKRRPLSLRLLSMRHRHLLGEWSELHLSFAQIAVLVAQCRSFARFVIADVVPSVARSTYRILTYSPFRMYREWRGLRKTLAEWKGQHVFLFPYVSMGGAEQVHLGIVEAVRDRDPLVIVCGYSKDRSFEDRFTSIARIVEIPRLLNHPFTAGSTLRTLARAINAVKPATVLGSLTTTFYDLLPSLDRGIRIYSVQHAFLYQPDANTQQKEWIDRYPLIDAYLFPSTMALREFDKFLFHQNIGAGRASKLLRAPITAPSFGSVRMHDRLGLLFVGRDSTEKRPDLFLRIVGALETAFPGRFRSTTVGLHARTDQPDVEYKGAIGDPDQLARVYADHDLLLLTSTREGHCLVVTEAMANGMAVVSTPVGDVSDRVNASTGVLTTGTDEETVFEEMKRTVLELDADRERLHALKTNALELIRRNYDPAEFRRFYRGLFTDDTSSK